MPGGIPGDSEGTASVISGRPPFPSDYDDDDDDDVGWESP